MKKDRKNVFKKVILFCGITVLYIFTPLLIVAALDKMVSLKYEVDHGYFMVDANKELTDEQKKIEFDELDQKGKALMTQYYIFMACSILAFTTATGLIIKRNKIIGEQ